MARPNTTDDLWRQVEYVVASRRSNTPPGLTSLSCEEPSGESGRRLRFFSTTNRCRIGNGADAGRR